MTGCLTVVGFLFVAFVLVAVLGMTAIIILDKDKEE